MPHVDLSKVRQKIKNELSWYAYVDFIKKLELWEGKQNEYYLSADIRFIPLCDRDELYMLESIKKTLVDKYHISHAVIQYCSVYENSCRDEKFQDFRKRSNEIRRGD